MGKTKKKFEFSKLILFVFGVIEVGVVLFTCYMVHLTCDLTPLAYLIPSTAIVGRLTVDTSGGCVILSTVYLVSSVVV